MSSSGPDAISLLRALVSVAKSCLTKSQVAGMGAGRDQGSQENMPGTKKSRRQIIPSQLVDPNSVLSFEPGAGPAQSPVSEASPTQGLAIESPVQVFIFSLDHSATKRQKTSTILSKKHVIN